MFEGVNLLVLFSSDKTVGQVWVMMNQIPKNKLI